MTTQRSTQSLDRLDIPTSWPTHVTTEMLADNVSLEDPKTATQWRTVEDPNEIEKYLLLRNYQHFGQAAGTPFTIDPLRSAVDWTATSETSTRILTGVFDDSSILDPLCKRLLKQLKITDGTTSIPAQLTIAEFKGKIKAWNERTSTSPSGRHLGRYKALFADSSYPPGTPESDEFLHKQTELVTLIVRILNTCIAIGHPLSRWTRIVNTMIFKEEGVYRVHKLRVIHIFEADLNLVYATKWRQLIRAVDERDALHEGQFGGRPGYEATSMALLEELRVEASYLTRRTLLTFDNDAASCYDRIVVSVASIINRKYGMDPAITRLHGRLLEATKYQLKTAIGVSTTFYTSTKNKPLYGTGQGSGNSPGIWLLISNTLFQLFDTTSHGANFTSADGHVHVHLSLSGFVDDTNAVVNDFTSTSELTIEELIQRLLHDAQQWSYILHLSGGKLELPKCSFHALRFKFKANGSPLVIQSALNPLPLRDPSTNQITPVPYLPPTKAHKIVGHWKAPADNQGTQLHHLLTKANQVSLLIAMSHVTRAGAHLAYTAKYLAMLRYVLPQCWFNPVKLRIMERQSLPRIIAKCGFSRKTPISLIFATRHFAGAGFTHWSTIQGTGQILHFIKHWRTDSSVSKMLKICLSWAQFQSGISSPILVDVNIPLPHLESRWITSLRQYLSCIQGYILTDNPFVQPKEREGDHYIMDIAITSGLFTPSELKFLNYCRIYLHVQLLSEICEPDGRQLNPMMYECIRPPWFPQDTTTVLQQRPSYHQIRFQWQRFCRSISYEDLSLSENFYLGPWSVGSTRLQRETYFDQNTNKVYIWKDTSYWTTRPHPIAPWHFRAESPTDWQPHGQATPVNIIKKFDTTRFHISPPTPNPPKPRIPVPATFDEYMSQLHMSDQQFLQSLHWAKTPFQCVSALLSLPPDSHIYVVSQGRLSGNRTVRFGTTIGTSSGQILVQSQGALKFTNDSHRAAGYSILAATSVLFHLYRFTCVEPPPHLRYAVFNDHAKLVNDLNRRSKYVKCYPNATLATNWDVIEEIHQTCKLLANEKLRFHWTRRHPFVEDEAATMNITYYRTLADGLAHQQATLWMGSTLFEPKLSRYTGCLLFINQVPVTGQYSDHIRKHQSMPEVKQYLMQRHNWDQLTWETIDWELFHNAATSHRSSNAQLMKLIHDKLPTNYNKSKSQPTNAPTCYFCPAPGTFHHLCTSNCHTISTTFRDSVSTKIDDFLATTDAPQEFIDQFSLAVRNFFAGNPQTNGHDIGNQQCIGQHLFFRGFISRYWRKRLQSLRNCTTMESWLQAQDSNQPSVDATGSKAPKIKSLTLSDLRLCTKLLHLIWDQMIQLWHDYTQLIHNTTPLGRQSRLHDLYTEIRKLHLLRPTTLPQHQDTCFHEDLEHFLSHASEPQLQRYLHRYKPVIYHSIRQAAQVASNIRRIPQYFSRLTRQPPDTNKPKPFSTRSKEGTLHRKHTRIRKAGMHAITRYFPSLKSSPNYETT